MNVIEGTGEIVVEPDWDSFLKFAADKSAAREYWRAVTTEMRSRNILSQANGHAIGRLVMLYLAHDKAAVDAVNAGPVLKPKRSNPKAIARTNPSLSAMKDTGAAAMALEAELGLPPRRRNAAAVVEKKTQRATGADQYLKPKSA